jgi:hypothetical protein
VGLGLDFVESSDSETTRLSPLPLLVCGIMLVVTIFFMRRYMIVGF